VRLRLWQRLFLILAVLLLAALGAFAFVQQRQFRAGLLDYVNALDLREAEALAARVAGDYALAGGWQLLRDRPQRFVRLIGPEGADELPLPPPRAGLPPRARNALPPGPGAGPPGGPGALPPLPRGGADLRPRLQLVDADGARVAGNPEVPADAPSVPVVVEGRVVGALRVAPLPKLADDRDLAFQRQQLAGTLALAAALLVGALLASLFAARAVLAPLRRLSNGVRALAAGDLAARSPVATRDEVGELSEDFNRMAESLQRQQGVQRQWMAEISHELRTPLAVLRGELAALEDGVRPLDRAALASLSAECGRLSRLVDDLYDLSVADAGGLRYRFEPTDLVELVRDAADPARPALASAGLTLTLDLPDRPCLAAADPRRLRQLVDNLLGNAARYTDAPGRVLVVLRARDDGFELRVEDTAPGVPEAALPRLFDPLFRVEASRARHAGGAGLGLAIAARIAQAHHGRIAASHSPLGGLGVALWLPKAPR
jgi:two-component system sensor histidine kinase BaeS